MCKTGFDYKNYKEMQRLLSPNLVRHIYIQICSNIGFKMTTQTPMAVVQIEEKKSREISRKSQRYRFSLSLLNAPS